SPWNQHGVDPTLQIINQPGEPTRSGNAFSTSTSAPYKLGRYWVAVSAVSMKQVDGCLLRIGTRASASKVFSVTKPVDESPPGGEPPGEDPPAPPGP
ncbi:MAG: hypothetical protein NTU88_00875, partial [Armatimonadetes bacterium]|nr:hypothetical protein [Armatimonadota bacterium]